jgi:large subunit ribosomal protein L5
MESTKIKEGKSFDLLKEKFSFKNIMQAPKIERIIVSTGVGKYRQDKKKIELVEDRMAKITGQKPARILSKKSIATFKVRAGDLSAMKVTLNGDAKYNFLDKFLKVALPATKDFRGISKTGVDQMGNLSIGVKDNTVFPETANEDLSNIFGLSIVIVTTAKTKEEAEAFFEIIGIPFKKELKK